MTIEAARPTVAPPRAIQLGQRWKYIWPDGREVEYVVEFAEYERWPDEQTYWHYVRLLNEKTGKCAWASISTLHNLWTGDPTRWEFVG